jgi:hypothetical protein
MKNYLIFILFLLLASGLKAQADRNSELFLALKTNDSLLFNLGFNQCDIKQFEDLIGNNFEFYHDQSGITNGKQAFIASIRDGLCKLTYKPERVLVDSTLEVFPLYNNQVLYGAIQNGTHQFFAIEKDNTRYLTSTARFTHLWILENNNWKLIRGLSYDHQPAGKEK